MESPDDRIHMLKEDAERIRKEKPHVGTLLDAFMPVIENEIVMGERIAAKNVTLSPDRLKTMGGIPIIREHPLFLEDDPWQDLVDSTGEAIREGFPHLAEEMNRLTAYLHQNPGEPGCIYKRCTLADEDKMSALAAEIQVGPVVLSLLLNSVQRIVLTGRAKNMAKTLVNLPWSKGYCPVCGSFPMLAFLRINGQRWLHCNGCHHEWTYPRPQCPWCEHETPEDTTYLFVEDDKENSAYVCEKCRKYLVTVNRPENMRETDPDLTAISLAHLDVILQEKGFSPMALREWNQF